MYILIIILLLIIVLLLWNTYKLKEDIYNANMILDDIEKGNIDRKIVVSTDSQIAELCFKINDIMKKYKYQIMNLEQSEKTYRQLVTNLSHDIRTPLASLMGYLGAIEDKVVVDKEKDEYITLSYEKSIILKNYIETLFEWLKIEAGEKVFDFENIDICELSREIIIDWIPQLEQLGIEYTIDIPDKEIAISIDRRSYKRIIENLLQNILVHSKADKIELGVHDNDDEVLVKIADNGIGISNKDIPHIFERLYKCDTTRSGQGNGLGLSIVLELVKSNNGKINIDSDIGKGCCFTISLKKQENNK